MTEEVATYIEWSQNVMGIIFPKPLQLIFFENTERGVCCQEDVEENSPLLKLPFDALLTKYHSLTTPFAHVAASLREDDLLALLLLFEKIERKNSSKYYPHIKMLPAEYFSIVNYSTEQLSELKGCNLHVTATMWKQQIQSDYNALVSALTIPVSGDDTAERVPILDMFPWFSLEEYRWALCSVWSRFVTINRKGEALRSMVPFFDFLNHRPDSKITHIFDSESDVLKLLAMERIPANTEITLNYGNKSNEELLKLYGFVIPPRVLRGKEVTPLQSRDGLDYILVDDNPYNCVSVYAALDPRTPLYLAKKTIMNALHIPMSGEIPFKVTMDSIPNALLNFVRIQHAQSLVQINRLASIGGGPLIAEGDRDDDDIALECAAVDSVIDALRSMLSAYPWNMRDDELRFRIYILS